MSAGLNRLAAAAVIAIAWFAAPLAASADEAVVSEVEIEQLLVAIGESGCEFIRNGKRHSASDAESHLRMKYKRARRYAKTAELFIERLATASSMTRRPYEIDCGGEPERTGDWLKDQLDGLRADAGSSEAS
jgi:hypothetical protein